MPRAPLLLLLLLSLGGCAEVWVRPGTPEAVADATNAACARQAALEVPPLWERRLVRPARYVRDERCWREHGRRVCVPGPLRWVPAEWETVDLNAPIREEERRRCMFEQGFTFQGHRPLRL